MMSVTDRYRVMDCLISRVTMESAVARVSARAATCAGGYVCFSNVHSIVTSRNDKHLRNITNQSFMSMPDGKPVAAFATWCGIDGVSQVAGPDFMPVFLKKNRSARNYFYGSTEETLALLLERLKQGIPELNIVGSYSPPFGEIPDAEQGNIIAEIQRQKPDYIWVGLGAPRQEYWMARHWEKLKPAVLFGVGAAFDFHAGTKSRAPRWMRRFGLEWLHRLLSEPRRLWRRYLITNTIFLFYSLKDIFSGCGSSRDKSK